MRILFAVVKKGNNWDIMLLMLDAVRIIRNNYAMIKNSKKTLQMWETVRITRIQIVIVKNSISWQM